MTVTYLVAIDLFDPTTIADTALDIEDALAENGLEVTSVTPWARPATGEISEAPPPLF
jgi:hypothetical protein